VGSHGKFGLKLSELSFFVVLFLLLPNFFEMSAMAYASKER
jgi:hypothetical protein